MEISNNASLLESRCLRRAGWLLPLLGLLAGLAWGTHGWHAVTLDSSYARSVSDPAALRFALMGAALGGMAWALWAVSLALGRRFPAGAARFTLPLLLALGTGLALEAVSRRGGCQNPFWLAVRARLQPGDAEYFVRELSYWRLDAGGAAARATNAIVVAGSSQVLHGIDTRKLEELTGRAVKRRALAGMDPIKAVGALEWLQVRAGDTLVLYLSEFDLAGGEQLDLNWMRPMTGPAGARAVRGALPRRAASRQWRALTDLALASCSELWRVRDYVSQLVFRPFGAVSATAAKSHDPVAVQAEQYAEEMRSGSISATRVECLRRLLRAVKDAGGSVVMFEGQVNPNMAVSRTPVLREQAREALGKLAADAGFTFVPVSEQQSGISGADWLDGTHLNEQGREKLTQVVARFLHDGRGGR